MYCKLFASLYQGTLRGNSHGILVFTNLLANCDAQGFVDKHWRAIAEEVGLTVNEVKAAISVLEQPDPESRSHDLNGARIVKMDEHREWGWRVVNYLKYRSIRDQEDRREQNRLAQQRFRESHKPPSAIVSQDKPPSSQGEAEGKGKVDKQAAVSGTRASKISDPQFIESLKSNPAYDGINIDAELGKMDAWLLLNPSRQKTPRFVLKWLNRIEKPLASSKKPQKVDGDGIIISSGAR